MYCRKIKVKKGHAWECSEELPKDPVTGKRKRVSARASTQKEARLIVERKIHEVTEYGLTTDPSQSSITFEKMAQEWLATLKNHLKHSAYRSNEYHVRRFGKYIANVPVRQITKKAYQNVINQLERDGYSYNTIYSAHSVAKKIFRQALAWDIIKSSPADMAILPKKKVTIEQLESEAPEVKYLEREELKFLLDVVGQKGRPGDEVVFKLLAFTGMRVGELLALKWRDIDFEKKEISITKTIFNIDGKKDEYKLLTPKTKKSIRKVTVDDNILLFLKKHRIKQNEQKMKIRSMWHNGDFIVTRDDGYPMSPRFIQYRMKRLEKIIKQETGECKPLHAHILRHTHTSMLTEAGVDLRAIMDRLGHSDARTTLTVYTHVTEKLKRDASDKLAEVFSDLMQS